VQGRDGFSDLLGGWPGGLLAQRTFRHKVSKSGFIGVFWITAFLNTLVLLTLISPPSFWNNASYPEYRDHITTRIQRFLEIFNGTNSSSET
jgi:hypothetical protein